MLVRELCNKRYYCEEIDEVLICDLYYGHLNQRHHATPAGTFDGQLGYVEWHNVYNYQEEIHEDKRFVITMDTELYEADFDWQMLVIGLVKDA